MNFDNIDEIFSLIETMPKKIYIDMLKCLDDIYYNSDNPDDVLPDEYYDVIRDKYEERFGPWEHVGAVVSEKVTVKLPYYLGSMDKYKPENEKEIQKFSKKYTGPYLIEDKLDGVSGLLIYYPGGEVKLFTRGNGTHGVDISNLIPYFKLPELDLDYELAIRGEIIMQKKVFEKKFATTYKNARNLVSGVVNAKKVNQKAANKLDFVCYEVIEPKDLVPSKQLDKLRDFGFNVVNTDRITKLSAKILDNHLKKFRENSVYEIDGIIIICDHVYPRNKSGNPKYAFAFKNLSNLARTTVEEVFWKSSKHGVLKPRVKIKPIDLAGITITYATGHNAKNIVDNKIGKGAVIEITRSGDVIPYIVRVIKPGKVEMPDVAFHWNDTEVDIVIDQEDQEMIVSKIYHFFSKLDVKGMGEKTVEKIVASGRDMITDVLHMTAEDYEIIGLGPKVTSNLLKEIAKKTKNVDLALLMASTSIFGFGMGKKKITLITAEYPNLLKERMSIKKIADINGWSETSAEQFLQNLPEFKKFLKKNPQITYKTGKKTNSNKYAGMKIVFSGFRDKALEAHITDNGGKVTGTVSKNTTLVIVDDVNSTSSKVKKARDLGIQIIAKENFV